MKINLISALLLAGTFCLPSCTCRNDNDCPTDSLQEETSVDDSKNQIVRLNVFYSIPEEGNRAQAVEVARKLIEASRTDEGCLTYDLFESTTVPGEYIIMETWANDSLLSCHSNAPHFKEYVPILRNLGEMRTDRFTLAD